jgi:ADP-heptose:LPS heptosyltransferase
MVKKKIIILLHHGLGDVIMSQKLIRNVGDFFKKSLIFLVVKSNVEKSFLDTLKLDDNFQIVVLNYTGTFKSKVSLSLKFFSIGLKKTDVLLAAHSTNKMLGNIFSKILRSKISIGPEGGKYYSETTRKSDLHKTDYYLDFLLTYIEKYNNKFNLEIKDSKNVNFGISDIENFPNDYKFILNSNYIIISPGTSPFDTHKRWPSEKYIYLIREIFKNFKIKIVLLGSKADNEVLDSIFSQFVDTDDVIKINDLPIKYSMFLISKSKVIISACTSSLHMASAVGANMLSLYGPTNYSITGPASEKNRIVRLGYSCSPCFRDRFTSGCGTPRCMTDIKVDQVMTALTESMMNKEIPDYPKIKTTNSKRFQI